ncbi:MAG: galactose-1-phosphate uridylyltransferase, partial [Pseudobutyrivibrio sp.]|nr:galactose-1-phosphate uridylyltransferase [Pseudobutyrivibrio sp.]
MLQESIKKLVQYGINTGLTPECEKIYTTNLLLECMKEDEYTDPDIDLNNIVLEDVLKDLL